MHLLHKQVKRKCDISNVIYQYSVDFNMFRKQWYNDLNVVRNLMSLNFLDVTKHGHNPVCSSKESPCASDGLIGLMNLSLTTIPTILTAWRKATFITFVCTSKFIWIPEPPVLTLPQSCIRVMCNTKTDHKLKGSRYVSYIFWVFSAQHKLNNVFDGHQGCSFEASCIKRTTVCYSDCCCFYMF